jgi:hypothetical protein
VEHVGCWRRRTTLPGLLILLCGPLPLQAQTVGSILGRIVDAQSGQPLEAAGIEVIGTPLRSVSGADGRFIIGSVPPGERSLRIEHIGYKPKIIEGVIVRTGRSQDVRVELDIAPVALPGVTVEAERVRLVEPDVSTTHDIILARELRALPVDRLEQVIELTPGVSGGHFRGGRVGQEVHVVDGVELKNQFEAAREGLGLELSPSALEEVEVITGGFGAQYGSALSGVVSYITRRGSTERWEGRASLLTDEWTPQSSFRGFNALSVSAGGPLRFMGGNTTLFTDLLAQGMADAEPRARGLTCLTEADATADLAAEIRSIRENAPSLLCPYTHAMLPHQRGDKLIAFARLDRALSPNLHFNATVLRNRNQRELYTSEFRYSTGGQLGQRMVGTMGTVNMDWSRNTASRALHVAARVSGMRLDRYVGAVDPQTFDGTRVGGFHPGGFGFHGETAARRPIEEQIASPAPLAGYAAPTGTDGTPFGIAGTGIFFSAGTPHLASWAKTDVLSTDIVGEVMGVTGSSLRTGISSKLYRVESYERTLSHLAGSAPNYARFFPSVVSGFTEGRIGVTDEMTINAGIRVDAFRSGLQFRADRTDFMSPVIDASWHVSVNPRFGVAMPIPGTDGGAALRFNYGYVAQPPDFRYFLDTAVGDSLRTDIRRQGNPTLSFERGKSYEVGVSKLIGSNAGLGITLFRKELGELVTGSMRLGETGDMLYSTDDEGTVRGAELSLRGRWSSFGLRASYALQKATGVASGTESDSLISGDRQFIEYPLAFDRRHSIDVAAFYGRAAGASSPWSVALVSNVQSGYPIDRIAAGDATASQTYLPWTSNVDLRLTRELGRLPGCSTCAWRVTFDGRNLLGMENVIAVRRDTGGPGPSLTAVRALVDGMPAPDPIPMESPHYTRGIDVNGDGIITAAEFRMARMAAAIDRFDPSLYFGEPRQLRLGLEIAF